jgi:hypothetical protein
MHTWSNCNEQASIFFPTTHAIKLQQRCSDFRTRTFKVIAVYLLQESLCPMMRESSHAVGYTMKAASAVAALLAHHFWRFLGWSKEDPEWGSNSGQSWTWAWEEEEAGLCSFLFPGVLFFLCWCVCVLAVISSLHCLNCFKTCTFSLGLYGKVSLSPLIVCYCRVPLHSVHRTIDSYGCRHMSIVPVLGDWFMSIYFPWI